MYSITSSFVDFLEGFTEIQHVYVSDISLRHSLEKVRGDDQVLRLSGTCRSCVERWLARSGVLGPDGIFTL